ncbi:rCG25487 [Rattus norvegicus]|uniref:RCG25487 n=1 Tax=Rattus norvegicus TaxID=10116 RepID=A6I2E9_RAT|nr:rCG25487 [Rattus norvegicus]
MAKSSSWKKEFHFSLWSRGLEPVMVEEAWQPVSQSKKLDIFDHTQEADGELEAR